MEQFICIFLILNSIVVVTLHQESASFVSNMIALFVFGDLGMEIGITLEVSWSSLNRGAVKNITEFYEKQNTLKISHMNC